MIGRTLGSYRVIEQIGMGGMATVYKAYDAATDRHVAIKVLPEYYSKDPTFRERFEREAKAIARMEHLHVLPIFTYGDEDGMAYLVMRYMQAGTLADVIGQGPLPVTEANRLLTQIASALDYAHKHGILHRDVKPSNVLVDVEGNAFLTDFGIAKMVEGSSELTGSGLIGTPHYMSPEQCQGAKDLTAASDQYSLGIVLYEMLTGSKPYQAETPMAIILMQMNGPLPSPRRLRADITEEMEAVIYKALAKQPEMRYPSCTAMAEAFARAAQAVQSAAQSAAETVHSYPDSEPEPATIPVAMRAPGQESDQQTIRVAEPAAPEPARARRFPAWAVGLLAVIVVGGGILAAALSGVLPTGGLGVGPSPTPASPVLALKGVRHAFVCGDSSQALCFERAGSGEPPIRVETGLDLHSAAWSPDGRQLVITAREPGAGQSLQTHPYIMNLDDGSLRKIENDRNNDHAAWSPNGSWIVMHSDGSLAVIRPDGTDFHEVWREDNWCSVLPQWSPDSKRIVFTVVRCGQIADLRRVFMATLDGIITPIAEVPIPPGCQDAMTAFSPDGRLIAYIDAPCKVKLVNADGSPTTQTMGEFNMMWMGEYFPQWGPTEQ